jgi:hypothetical protein
MNLVRTTLIALGVVWLAAVRSDGQTPSTPANAALRYWMAFAVLRDPPADQATANLLERVAEGSAPWDEAQLGKILDANREAIEIMARASMLTSCDWGIEYDLGPNAPIPHLAKARVLGRLAVLGGIRLAATGQSSQAVDAWLVGVRFSQHVAQGGSLISLLSAQRVLIPTLRALTGAVSRGTLDAVQRKKIETAIRALPETAFDWGAALRREEASLNITLGRLSAARDPAVYFAAVTQLPAPPRDFVPPTAADIAAFHAVITRMVDALRLLPNQERQILAEIGNGRKARHPFFQRTLPSPEMLNSARFEIRARRQTLLDALARP